MIAARSCSSRHALTQKASAPTARRDLTARFVRRLDPLVTACWAVQEDSALNATLAAKAADVALLELRLANRLGGKSYALIWGTVGEVEAAIAAGVATVPEGVLVQQAVIPNLHPDLRNEITRGLTAE